MKRYVARGIDWIDDRLAAATLAQRRERPALLGFLFHSVFASAEEVAADRMWPAQPLLASELSRFIAHFLSHGYRFVSPAEIRAGLDPAGYYALLTFDDGYANNQRALPILRAHGVPATFFISAHHVTANRAFWWDVVYRERRRRDVTPSVIRAELRNLKRRRLDAIEAWVEQTFGADALRPIGETDRPFSVDELRTFASDPLVTLGNHTMRHVNLTQETDTRVATEIRECQDFLTTVTGTAPEIFAYPDGIYDERSVSAASSAGIQLAVTVGYRKTQLPLRGTASMHIPRAFVPCGAELLPACLRSRSDVRLRRWLDALLR